MSPVRFLVAPQREIHLSLSFFVYMHFVPFDKFLPLFHISLNIITFASHLRTKTSMIKIILRIVGTVSLILGIIGIALPVLPTTPFLLLTAYCYLKSAPAWHKRLLESKHFGPYIKNFQENKCIPVRIKVYSISMLWITICISCIFVSILWVRLLLLGIAVGVTWHILSYPSQPKR